jgi:hypothetical protein
MNRFLQNFEFEGDKPECPKCGAQAPIVIPLIDVHFVVMDKSGPIFSARGRQRIACQPNREIMAAHAHDNFAASDYAPGVTCRSCRGTREWQQEMTAHYPVELGTFRIVDPGCCG